MILPSLDIITGPMYSGKSTELLRRLSIFSEMGLKVLYINSSLASRSNKTFSTHNPSISNLGIISSQKVDNLNDIKEICKDYEVIGIDEAQFFKDLVEFVLSQTEEENKQVIVSGLNSDYLRKPFGFILNLIPYCDNITKLNSFCHICCKNRQIIAAPFINREVKSNKQILVGGKNEYYPLCRKCYLKSKKNKKLKYFIFLSIC